jgi:putative endonuclease
MMWYVYVIKSVKSNNWYTGFTSDLKKRFKQHNSGQSTYTRPRGPYELIYYEASLSEKDARSRELYLKSGMGKRYLKNRLKNSILVAE